MRIISFAYTTPAILAREKSVTRRNWKPKWAASFRKGQVCSAYSKGPRFGGFKVGEVEIVRDPYWEYLGVMPDTDYEAEGFAYLHEAHVTPPRSSGFKDFSRASFDVWRSSGGSTWVVRFRVVSLLDAEFGDHVARGSMP